MPVASGPIPLRQQLLTLLRGFLLDILPSGVEVVVGQANRVPQPVEDNSVVMVPMELARLATTVDTWSMAPSPAPAPTEMAHEQDVRVTVWLHVFGEDSTDNCNLITTLLRSSYATEFFWGTGVTPLTCDDGQQIPFFTGEDQFQDRWILKPWFELALEVSTTQQFADTVEITVGPPADALTP